MAEPPNALTDLLRGKPPQEMYESLKAECCLSSAAIQDPDHVIGLIAAVMQEADAAARQGMVGGTAQYQVVIALLKAAYLNDKARKLLAINTVNRGQHVKPWWRFW